MSNNNQQHKDTKLLLLAGIIAAGVFASAFGSMQLLLSASAQVQNTDDDPMPVDLGCETGAEFCEDEVRATVSTSGTATTSVKPDKFSVTVGVETEGPTAEEAASSNADLVAAVIAALKDLGIAEDDISTSSYNVYPVHSQSEPVNACRVMEGYPIPPECYVTGEVVVSYKAVNMVTITLDADSDVDAGEVIDAAIEAGATNVSGMYFFVSAERQEEIRDSLIGDAIANARHRAEVAAEAVGLSISGIKSINLNDVYFPVFSRGFVDAAAEGATPVLPGRQQVSMTVSIAFFMSGEASENGFGQREAAMDFLLTRLPELGIEIDDEFDIHMDMITHISENEYHADFGVVDVDGEVHDGHIEVVDGEVAVAILDGGSIL